MLRYFKNEADEFPKGQISLQGEIELDTSARPQFVIFSVEFPRGLLVRCDTLREMDEWVSSLSEIHANIQAGDMAIYKRMELPTWGWW